MAGGWRQGALGALSLLFECEARGGVALHLLEQVVRHSLFLTVECLCGLPSKIRTPKSP